MDRRPCIWTVLARGTSRLRIRGASCSTQERRQNTGPENQGPTHYTNPQFRDVPTGIGRRCLESIGPQTNQALLVSTLLASLLASLLLLSGCVSTERRTLDGEAVRRVREGMTRQEVMQLLGPPDKRVPRESAVEIWLWADRSGANPSSAAVVFSQDRVAEPPRYVVGFDSPSPPPEKPSRRDPPAPHPAPLEPPRLSPRAESTFSVRDATLAEDVRVQRTESILAPAIPGLNETRQRYDAQRAERIATYLATNADLPEGVRLALEAYRVCEGMTTDEARLAWGFPERIQRVVTSAGIKEEWFFANNRYLQFNDGLLATWNDGNESPRPQ